MLVEATAEQPVVAEQIAAPADEGTTASDSAAGEQQESQESQAEGKAKPDPVQKRIDKAVRAQREAEREAEFWRKQALKGQATPPAETQKPAPKAEGKPTADKYASQAEFFEALAEWKAKELISASKAAESANAIKSQADKAVQGYQAKENAFREATPDFDEVMADAADLEVSNALIAEIVDSEHGPQLKYYLAKNPDEAKRLSALGPLALAREVGRIESRFQSTAGGKSPTKVTGAPAPPTPTSKPTSTAPKDWGEASPREYQEARRKGLIK